MRPSLRRRAARATIALTVMQGAVLFLCVGTLAWWHAWLYLALQLSTMMATNLWLEARDPDLLESRLRLSERGEDDPTQRTLMRLFHLTSLVLLAAPALHARVAGGAAAPDPRWPILGTVLFLAGVSLVVAAMRANPRSSSVVEVVPDAHPIARGGPYRVVRHPMYAGFLVMGVATPLVLGSLASELAVLPALAVLVARLLAEERFLVAHLPGYADYLRAVPARLVPGLW